jgi:hypothetical protein
MGFLSSRLIAAGMSMNPPVEIYINWRMRARRTLYKLAAELASSNGGASAGALRFQGFHDLA